MKNPLFLMSKLPAAALRTFSALLLAAALVQSIAAQPEALETQSLTLQPGWNSIWLEVDPANRSLSEVFAGVPIDSVWTFQERLSSVSFIQNPNEPVWNRASWRVYVPTNRVESINDNLFTVTAHRAYLVKLNNSGPVTLQVTGKPSVPSVAWVPDAYNLRGFPIAPSAPPTFQSFFRSSPAHFSASQNRLEKIYRLNSAGQWTLVNGSDSMRAGEAYWLYTRGNSDFVAPLTVLLESGDGLDYSGTLSEITQISQSHHWKHHRERGGLGESQFARLASV